MDSVDSMAVKLADCVGAQEAIGGGGAAAGETGLSLGT